jgi:predicted MFS family arabinose efflux permease
VENGATPYDSDRRNFASRWLDGHRPSRQRAVHDSRARPIVTRRFSAVLAERGASRLLTSGVIARLPLGMTPLAILLFVRDRTGSFALAGLSVGGYGLANAAVNPMQGILVDRVGPLRVLPVCAVAQAVAITAFTITAEDGFGAGASLAAVVLAGAFVPPVSGCLRALWPQMVASAALDAAYTLDAITQEIVWTLGPLLVAAAVTLSSPATALLLCAGITLAGTLGFVSVPLVRRARVASRAVRGASTSALSSPGLRVVLLTTLLFGIATGGLEVAIPAQARALNATSSAGLMLALWSVGSMIGGLVYGAQKWAGPVGPRYRVLLVTVAAMMAPLALVRSLPAALAAAALAGLPNAPWLACEFSLVGALAPEGRLTEAFTWTSAAITGGVAMGAALAGAIVSAISIGAAVLTSCSVVSLGVVIAAVGRQSTDAEPAAPLERGCRLRCTREVAADADD